MIIKQKLGIKILMVALGALLLLVPFAGCAAEAPEKAHIIFADLSWDSAQVHSRIAAFILEHGYGYPPSEFVPVGTIPGFQGLVRGDLDVNMEVWVESMHEAYFKAIEAGEVVNLGSNFPDSWQGWVVPTYMIKGDPARGIEPMAPDLKSIDDLAKYWELFKDPEEPSKGRFYSCVPGWVCQETNEMKMEAYGLDEYYNIFLPGSDAALSGSMVAAYEKGEPWFGYYWEPTWVLGKLDMTRLEEPPYDEEVWDTTKACAYSPGRVDIVATPGLLDRAPEVVEFLRNYETTVAQNNKCLAYMQETEASTTETAMWFLKELDDVWTKWVPLDVATKVKAALP